MRAAGVGAARSFCARELMPQDESDEEEESDPELDGVDREALQAMP